ncbi:macro domain-containing protein [Streptomyces sp. NBC_01481]|uniref:macro domain-containing protein n=1 Tax=Streptomyces sp. NBC_01481 TaxID=2975869 RepID=UPI002255D7F5|nr:macro domain-containing protein [Streptomyces sp. NBC_01481]MCX4583932.1 macro domain-containing protein [Streptomyces sp. NBC_01481]
MPRNSPVYRIGSSTFSVSYGLLEDSNAEVLVSSDDNYLTMGGGVSRSLLRSGGSDVLKHSRKMIPLSIGDVAVTTAGKLPAKYIFHAVTIDLDRRVYPDHRCIRDLVNRALDLAEFLRIRTISFPALGTGVAGFPFYDAAAALVPTICDRLAQNMSLQEVNLLLTAREGVRENDLTVFYERAASLASVAAQGQRLAASMGRLQDIVGDTTPSDLKSNLSDLLSEIRDELATIARSPRSVEEIDRQQESHVASTGRHVVELIDGADGLGKWKDLNVERKALQTRLEGLSTLLNVHYGSLNKLEIEKARYAGVGIPVILENQIEEVNAEIRRVEELTRETRRKVESLPEG